MQVPSRSLSLWLRLAKRYVWWQIPEEAVREPHRIMAQVMNIGTLEDVALLRGLVGDQTLRQVLAEASPGEFSDRSWHFWHQILSAGDVVAVPPLPQRRIV